MENCLCGNTEIFGKGKYKSLCVDCRKIAISESLKKTFAEKKKNDPDYAKKKSPRCVEHWIAKGFTKEQAANEIKKIGKAHSVKLQAAWDSGNFNERLLPTHLDYWINLGFTIDEAKNKISERQRTFSLEKCIDNHGVKDGERIFKERQLKWQISLYENNDMAEVNKKKGFTLTNYIRRFGEEGGIQKFNLMRKNKQCGYSKMSQDLFWDIYNQLPPNIQEKCYFAELNYEFHKTDMKSKLNYAYDFVISSINVCIEFNGDSWHGNPQLFKDDFFPHPFYKNVTAKELQDKDKIKNNFLKSQGFDILTIWEYNYKQNKQKELDKCLKMISSHALFVA